MKQVILLAIFIISFVNINARQKEIVFATYTYDTITRVSNLKPVAALLSKKTGIPVRVVSYPSVSRLIDAIRHDSVDIAMMNTSGYLIFQRKYKDIIEPLVNLDMGDDTLTNYAGCIIASRSSGVNSIQKLISHPSRDSFALVNPSSTSGNLLPRLLLNSNGLHDPAIIFNVYYAGTHKKVVDDVINGKAIAGGCGCAEVEKAKRVSDFTNKAIVIASFNNIPLGPIVYNKKMNRILLSTIKQVLLTVHTTDPNTFAAFCAGWTEFREAKHFSEVNDAAYDEFRKMFGSNEGLWRAIE